MENSRNEQDIPSILVVDDTPANLNLLCEILKERGCRPRPVPSGELALLAASVSAPDLILLDIDMPVMNGFEVCRRLKANPALRNIPIIFISALTEIGDKIRAFTAGGVDYIAKPFQFEEVNARVATHLELQRQRRELQARNDRLHELEMMRDNLVHMIVHDLRSPLAGLGYLVEGLREDESLPATTIEDLAEAQAALSKMSLMVTAVLDVSKLEVGALTPQLMNHDLVGLVKEALNEMRFVLGKRPVRLTVPEHPVPVRADRQLVLRVLQNLLSNAVKYTPREGDLRVGVEARGEAARLTVADQGPGIPCDEQQKIFEKFYQVEGHSNQDRPSTGLGLTFCKLAVEAHGGQIGVECKDGVPGSTFWFTLRRGEQQVCSPKGDPSAAAEHAAR